MADVGHCWTWLEDAVIDSLKGHPDDHLPPILRQWRRVDTSHKPIMRRGVMWDELELITSGNSTKQLPFSSLRSQTEIDKVPPMPPNTATAAPQHLCSSPPSLVMAASRSWSSQSLSSKGTQLESRGRLESSQGNMSSRSCTKG